MLAPMTPPPTMTTSANLIYHSKKRSLSAFQVASSFSPSSTRTASLHLSCSKSTPGRCLLRQRFQSLKEKAWTGCRPAWVQSPEEQIRYATHPIGTLHAKCLVRDSISFLKLILPRTFLSSLDRRTRLRMDERLVASANPACWRGTMRAAMRTTICAQANHSILQRGLGYLWGSIEGGDNGSHSAMAQSPTQ